MAVEETLVDGQAALALESAALRLVVVPGVGGKTVSCQDRRTGHEYLWRNPDPAYPLRPPRYGDLFDNYDISGWDECFPCIGECFYPDGPWRGVMVPDHGELWTIPWRAHAEDNTITLTTHGVRFPYLFEKRIEPRGDGLTITYRAANESPFPFKCLWSAHPLFAATPQTRVLLPDGSRARVEVSLTGRLGPLLTEHSWPATSDRQGREVDLSVMGPAEQREGEKLYTTPVAEGWAALHDGASDQWLAFTFDPAEIPLVGFWANRGAWPGTRPTYNLALEPCSGAPDRLDVAVPRGEFQAIPPNGELTWHLKVHVGQGMSALERIIASAPRR